MGCTTSKAEYESPVDKMHYVMKFVETHNYKAVKSVHMRPDGKSFQINLSSLTPDWKSQRGSLQKHFGLSSSNFVVF
jgi:hypothetical protein